MKKVWIATLMVALMMATVFHVNAVCAQKQLTVEEGTSDTYTIYVWVYDARFPPQETLGLPFVKVTVRSMGGTVNKVRITGIFGRCHFNNIPKGYELTIKAERRGFYQKDVDWWSETQVVIKMFPNGTPVKNPFINQFPLLKQLLQLV